MVRAVFSKTFLAYVLIAFFAVLATEKATFVAQEFDLLLLCVCEGVQFAELLVQSEIWYNIAEIFAIQFFFELLEVCQHFRCRRNEIKIGVLCFDVIEQQIGMDYDAVLDCAVFV